MSCFKLVTSNCRWSLPALPRSLAHLGPCDYPNPHNVKESVYLPGEYGIKVCGLGSFDASNPPSQTRSKELGNLLRKVVMGWIASLGYIDFMPCNTRPQEQYSVVEFQTEHKLKVLHRAMLHENNYKLPFMFVPYHRSKPLIYIYVGRSSADGSFVWHAVAKVQSRHLFWGLQVSCLLFAVCCAQVLVSLKAK